MKIVQNRNRPTKKLCHFSFSNNLLPCYQADLQHINRSWIAFKKEKCEKERSKT